MREIHFVAESIEPGAVVRVQDANGVDLIPVGAVRLWKSSETALHEAAQDIADSIDAKILADCLARRAP